MTADTDDRHTAGTVPSPEYRRTGCGMRFGEGELKAGIDFSGAAQLMPPASGSTLIREDTAVQCPPSRETPETGSEPA